MASSPLIVLMIFVPTLLFEGMIVGALQGEPDFPTFSQSDAVCSGDGFVDAIKCPFYWVKDLFSVLFSVVGYFLGLVTFNVPGINTYLRIAIAAFTGGPIAWSVATLIRGN